MPCHSRYRRRLGRRLPPPWYRTAPEWLVLEPVGDSDSRHRIALKAADLAAVLADLPADHGNPMDLLAIPARRLLLSPIRETASLWDALETLRTTHAVALYVVQSRNPLSVRGIVTEAAIRDFYRL